MSHGSSPTGLVPRGLALSFLLACHAGCFAPEAAFELNALHVLKWERAFREAFTTERKRELDDVLSTMFGTPDAPSLPSLASIDVAAVLDELSGLIERHVKKNAVGTFTLPSLLKIKTVKKPARKAQKGVPNPFRPGETMDVKAKPATIVVKVQPLKKLKDMAA